MLRTPEERRDRLAVHARTVRSEFGIPALVFYEEDLAESYSRLRTALDNHYSESAVHVAVKANYHPEILSVLSDAGAQAEAFAYCETEAAKRAGFAPDEILLTGMYRKESQIRSALRSGTSKFLVDNLREVEKLEAITTELGFEAEVLLRINPELEVPTHPHIATATKESKFGMSVSTGKAEEAVERVVDARLLQFLGIHCHLGSQIETVEPFTEAVKGLLSFSRCIAETLGVRTRVLDIGGGFPIAYETTVPPVSAYVKTVAKTIRSCCDEYGIERPELYLEPGRYLLGPSGTLLAEVGMIKETPEKTFAVLNAGTNTVLTHQSIPVFTPYGSGPESEYTVVGPLCHSHDVFRDPVEVSQLSPNDLIALDKIGAYTIGRETRMNGMPMPPIVLIRSDGEYELIREREECSDVIPGV